MRWRVELVVVAGVRGIGTYENLYHTTLIEGIYGLKEEAAKVASEAIGRSRAFSAHRDDGAFYVGMVIAAWVEPTE